MVHTYMVKLVLLLMIITIQPKYCLQMRRYGSYNSCWFFNRLGGLLILSNQVAKKIRKSCANFTRRSFHSILISIHKTLHSFLVDTWSSNAFHHVIQLGNRISFLTVLAHSLKHPELLCPWLFQWQSKRYLSSRHIRSDLLPCLLWYVWRHYGYARSCS